ncbi:hypothetical protein ACQ4LE_009636 [Meloidogyne hapla]
MPPPEFDFTIEEITAGKHLRKSQPVRQPQIVTPQNKKPKSEKKTKSKKPKKKKKGDGDPPPDKKGLAAGVVVPGTYEDIGPENPDKKQQKGADKGGNKKGPELPGYDTLERL